MRRALGTLVLLVLYPIVKVVSWWDDMSDDDDWQGIT
jgi:hypothetical protein